MAEAPLPPPLPTLVAVRVKGVSLHGKIEMEHAIDDSLSTMIPDNVELPIPSLEAYQLVSFALLKKNLLWMQKPGETVQYNIFLDPVGNDVTSSLYRTIVHMLDNPIGLPEVDDIGTCRISPIHYPEQIYVQRQPSYVDTVSYVINLRMEYMELKGPIIPAEELYIGKIYIYADGVRNYRVKLLQSEEESEADRDPFDRILGEKVTAFRIDYGGPNLEVNRADLYEVDSVCRALNDIPELAFPVKVQYINESDVDKDARIEELRTNKKIINIKTVAEAIGDTPALVNIFYEQNLDR